MRLRTHRPLEDRNIVLFRSIIAPDGLRLQTYEAGNPDGPEILFIHGFSQCSLCWQTQFDDPVLSAAFRLTAFDIRGHGASDRPEDPRCYANDRRFADDIAAVMGDLKLKHPVLVGWYYAGRLIGDYVTAHGTGRLAGINYVCARTTNDPEFNGPGVAHLAGMTATELPTNIAATRQFVRACFAREPAPDILETTIAYNMLVSATVRKAHLMRPADDGAILGRIVVPVLITQGAADLLVLEGLARLTASRIPNATLSIYDGIGHAPFIEDTQRFNRELAAFVLDQR